MDRLDADDAAPRRCQCGAHVGARWVRVFGVNGRLPACKHCYIAPNGTAYTTTYRALQAYCRGAGEYRGGHDD